MIINVNKRYQELQQIKRSITMPSKERRNEIEEKVNDILRENGLHFPSFDLIQFLTAKKNFQIGLQDMDSNTTGILLIDDDNFIPRTKTHRLIAINTNLLNQPNFRERRRFITAHEYGHSVLHKPNGHTQYAHRDTDKKETPQEREADFFARCLLMPRDLVDALLSLDFIKGATIDDKAILVSKVFTVTFKKAMQRLKEDLNYA